MPNMYPILEAEVASPDSNIANMTEYISVGETLKLVAQFKGERGTALQAGRSRVRFPIVS